MNIFIHEEYLKVERSKIRRRQLIAVALFFISFILSFLAISPTTQFLIFLAYFFLLAALPLWTSARAADRRLTAAPKANTLINEELRGLNNKYSLHHNPVVGGRMIPHLFIAPVGLVVLASSDNPGPVSCTGGEKGDRWRAPTNMLDRITGLRPPIGNPSLELDLLTASARSLLAEIKKPEVPVKGIVLFTKSPDISIDGCTYGAAPLDELKLALRDLEQGMGGDEARGEISRVLTADDRRRLNNILAPVSIPASARPDKPTRPASARR